MHKVSYLSGPMSAYKDLNFNYPAFNKAERHLRMRGRRVVNPAGLPGSPDGLKWNDCIRRDLLLMLEKANSIILLPHWDISTGAEVELYVANKLGWEVEHFHDICPEIDLGYERRERADYSQL